MATISDPNRGPADYDEREDTLRLLISIIRKQTEGAGGGNYNEAPKESNIKAVMIGCTITLLCAFIIGAVVFSNDFSSFKAQMTEWQKSTDRRLDELERRP